MQETHVATLGWEATRKRLRLQYGTLLAVSVTGTARLHNAGVSKTPLERDG